MSAVFQQGCALRILRRFGSVNKRTSWKLIGVILPGIHIAKASRGEETFYRLSLVDDQQRNLQSLNIPFLAGLRASKSFLGGNLRSPHPPMVTPGNRSALKDR